jgi:hypothetical protein
MHWMHQRAETPTPLLLDADVSFQASTELMDATNFFGT